MGVCGQPRSNVGMAASGGSDDEGGRDDSGSQKC